MTRAAATSARSRRIVRVAAVDGHPIVGRGVASLLADARPDGTRFEWLGRAHTFSELRDLLDGHDVRPDVVLCELGPAATEGIASFTAEGVAVVVLTDDLRPVPLRRAVEAGATGIIPHTAPEELIVAAVLAASRGLPAVSSDVARRLAASERLVPRLSRREIEVLQLLLDGVPRKSVGSRLQPPVQLATVVTYINRICRRYQDLGRPVHSTGDALRTAVEDGYLNPPGFDTTTASGGAGRPIGVTLVPVLTSRPTPAAAPLTAGTDR